VDGCGGIGRAQAAERITRGAVDWILRADPAGAADVVGRNEQGPKGFLVAHSDPPHRPDIIERYSLGWCNGPAGDAQVFRLLAQVTCDSAWEQLSDQCWHTITASGHVEHRATPPELEPHAGWAMGNAGIVRELLRYARVCAGRPDAYAVAWPDHPPTKAARRA
jgi:hypothetical protein